MASSLRATWHEFLCRARHHQSEIWLSVIYFAFTGPSALAARALGTRLLDTGKGRRRSAWLKRREHPTLDSLVRPF